MQEYYEILKNSDGEDVKSDMTLILNICAHNDIDTGADAGRVYSILNNNKNVFKTGIGRLFLCELANRRIDYRLIDSIKKDYDLTDFKDVSELVNGICYGEDTFKSHGGQMFQQKLIRLKNELEIIGLIRAVYDLNNREVVNNLYLALSEYRNDFFTSDIGKKFVRELEIKAGIRQNKRSKGIGIIIAVAVLFFVAGITAGLAVKMVYDNHRIEKTYDDISKLVKETPFSQQQAGEIQQEQSATVSLDIGANAEVLEKYSKLVEENAETAGWLKVIGTNIDYPVMHRNDNSFYLEHDFYGNYSRNGSLFIDRYCSIYPKSENIIIHGHNVDGAPSFGQIKYYRDESFYRNSPEIQFDTIYEEGIYEVVSAFVTSVETDGFKYYHFYGYDNEEQFNEFADYIKTNSLYDTGVPIEYGDQFITLSTCDYSVEEGRFVVVARKK